MDLNRLRAPGVPPNALASVVLRLQWHGQDPFNFHSGIAYKDEGADLVLHYGGHMEPADLEPFAGSTDPWVVAELDLEELQLKAIRWMCIRISQKKPRYPYGFLLDQNTTWNEETGEVSYFGAPTGISCATFVLLTVNKAGVQMLDLNSWTNRPDDIKGQRLLALSTKRVPGVPAPALAQIGAACVRPEEVMSSALLPSAGFPVKMTEAETASEAVLGRSFCRHAIPDAEREVRVVVAPRDPGVTATAIRAANITQWSQAAVMIGSVSVHWCVGTSQYICGKMTSPVELRVEFTATETVVTATLMPVTNPYEPSIFPPLHCMAVVRKSMEAAVQVVAKIVEAVPASGG
jgi:hypothetical protein